MRSRERVVGCVNDDPADEDDSRADLLARVAAMVTDPLHGRPAPPSPVTAADLIAMAEARIRQQPGDYTTEEERELARVARERNEAALLAAVRDDRLARRRRGRWWLTHAGGDRPDDSGEACA